MGRLSETLLIKIIMPIFVITFFSCPHLNAEKVIYVGTDGIFTLSFLNKKSFPISEQLGYNINISVGAKINKFYTSLNGYYESRMYALAYGKVLYRLFYSYNIELQAGYNVFNIDKHYGVFEGLATLAISASFANYYKMDIYFIYPTISAYFYVTFYSKAFKYIAFTAGVPFRFSILGNNSMTFDTGLILGIKVRIPI